MNYRRIKPSGAVGRYVEFYWILEDREPASSIQRVVPDGRSGIILNFAEPFESYTNGGWRTQPECFFVGQITGPLLLRPAGPARMVGIQFLPQGAMQLCKAPMAELTDFAITLQDFSRPLYRQLERVRGISSLDQAVTAVDNILQAFASPLPLREDPIACVVRQIELSGGLIGMADVATRIGWSTRQLQRRVKDTVGISPKLFGRMQRFQGVFRAMERSTRNWVNVAIDCGYYDQAHLIRDFREFSGRTPTSLLDREIDLTRHFVQASPVSQFSKTV